MKTVGIITVHHYGNYGSSLQAYASQRVFEQLGYETYIIDYRAPNACYATEKYMEYGTRDDSYWQGLERQKNGVLKRLIKKIISRPRTARWLYRTFGITRGVDLNQLWLEKMRLTRRYDNLQALFDDPPRFDICVVGGDQLWNTHITFNNPAFFLAFAAPTTKKISFATSIGIPAIPECALDDFKKGLNNLSAILVREEEGMNYLRSLGYPAERVLDPTLMLTRETWAQLQDTRYRIPYERYILAYFLDPDDWTSELLRTVQQQTGLPVILIGGSKGFAANNTYHTGNIETASFLTLFAHADRVVTNSFHGMAFTLLYQKKLIATYRGEESARSMNSRHRNFLKMFDLSDCLHNRESFSPEKLAGEMDYGRIEERLNRYRSETLALLRKALD